jgi:aryl-alcohol dehydrogenase-like predicted oxidoreductase
MNFSNFSPIKKNLLLGTALWGWPINQNNAYSLLEGFLDKGGNFIDVATNYPINKRNEDYGVAIKWLSNWKKLNQSSKLSLLIKIGSVDNFGSFTADLSPKNIINTIKRLKDEFEDSLSCISIHWDQRGGDAYEDKLIQETVDTFLNIRDSGLSIGLSGIKFPGSYFKACPALSAEWVIQVKENFITTKSRNSYEAFFPQAKYLAYGINLGGIKIGPIEDNNSIKLRGLDISNSVIESLSGFIKSNHDLEPKAKSINELALANAFFNPYLCGVIVAPSNLDQLENTLTFWHSLELNKNNLKNLEAFKLLSTILHIKNV